MTSQNTFVSDNLLGQKIILTLATVAVVGTNANANIDNVAIDKATKKSERQVLMNRTSMPEMSDMEKAIVKDTTMILSTVLRAYPELKIKDTWVSHAPNIKSCIFIKCEQPNGMAEDDYEAFSNFADAVYVSAIPALEKSRYFGMVSVI